MTSGVSCRLCFRIPWPIRKRHAKTNVVILNSDGSKRRNVSDKSGGIAEPSRLIRVATFNAAMFSMAPVVTRSQSLGAKSPVDVDVRCKTTNDRPKSILKQKSLSKAKLKVSINLPDNEISVERSKQLNSVKEDGGAQRDKASMLHSFSFPSVNSFEREVETLRSKRSIVDVLREVEADIIALQNVKAEEEKGMKPLSDLAEGLGMNYVFAESWAPEYGNAILSKWPVKQWKVQKICDESDFRNVLKATIDVPKAGEINFHCTQLDHLDENWRRKQIDSILHSDDGPHILAGSLNSLDETDYSAERWTDIVKYYEEIGKPTPKVEVMKHLKARGYLDARNFAGECEAVVILAKGQDVQGTCKYGTRVDYILASPNSPYKFVSGSYAVFSSKGTSDHHIVKVDLMIANNDETGIQQNPKYPPKQRIVKIDKPSSKGIWQCN